MSMYKKRFTKLTTADFANVFLNFDDNDEMVKRTIRSEAFEDGITKGKTEEKLKTANKLAVFYNVSLDYLLGLSQTSNKVKNNIDLNILSKRLKKLRKDNNLNQKDLSNIIKLPQTTYSNYERGYRIITTYKLITICKFYNTSMDYLTGKTNIKDLAFS